MSRPWKCPGCLRLVPARVETCYCGLQRSQVPAPAPARDSGMRGFLWTALAVGAVGTWIAAFSLGPRAPEPLVQATPVPARIPARVPSKTPPASQAAAPEATAAPTPAPSPPLADNPSPSVEPSSALVESLDDLREKAAQALDGRLQQLAARVESFRSNLRDYDRGCRSGGGPWPPGGCDALREDLRGRLDEIRTSLESTDEEARRASVYPGVRARLRRQHGLDEDAWNVLLRRSLETLE